MGSGTWTTSSYTTYATSCGYTVDALTGTRGVKGVMGDPGASQMYKSRSLPAILNPKNVLRECLDSEEHPVTIPVILALDVTGSMGDTAVQVAKNINTVMTEMYSRLKDVEFMIMGIGDLAYDDSPIQISQFESDVRIVEQMDQVYFEFGGGGNSYESYTAAWYMGARHCSLDAWKRGRKGIIITLGDEELNPHLPARGLSRVTGDDLQADVETKDLWEEASEKFDIYHINVEHRSYMSPSLERTWKEYLDDNHFYTVGTNQVVDTIIDIIVKAAEAEGPRILVEDAPAVQKNENGEIVW
jgi:hypothetical protein